MDVHHAIDYPNIVGPAKFRVGRVDSNDIGQRLAKAPSISSHESSSHERSGTVKSAVSGSGKKGTSLVFSRWSNQTHISDATEERKSFKDVRC